MTDLAPYDVPNRPAFRFRLLDADCQDCMFHVADRNGARVIRQLEAHAASSPDHEVIVTSGEYDPPRRTVEKYG